jgi:SAM-dependent methyltransferase
MQSFWEKQHAIQNTYWLSLYSGELILSIHNITNAENKVILDIGIGVGYLALYLHNRGNTVLCSDISTIALDNVKSFAKTYHTSLIHEIEPVDIAISNLVFQHCTDNEIERIIKSIRLKQDGYFSFQFAFLRDNEKPNALVTELMQNGTHHFRSLDTVRTMIERADKKIIYVSEPIHHYEPENFSWYIVHISNK